MAAGCALLVALLAGAAPARADTLDLRAAVDRALVGEARFRAALAENAAMQQEVPRARAALLPQLSASGTRTENDAHIVQTDLRGRRFSRDDDYVSENYALTLRQPLLRVDSWVRYRQAETRIAQSDMRLALERDELVLRIAESYLNSLLASATADFARAEVSALEGLATGAQKGFDAGTATRTDILDAEARLDAARVRLIEARHAIDRSRRELESLVGAPVTAIRDVDPARLALGDLDRRIEVWRDKAIAANPEIRAAAFAVELAEDEIRVQRAAHYPTVDLLAQRQNAESDSISALGIRSYTTLWGFQVNIPLFSGGHTTAVTRQAAHRLEAALAEHDRVVESVKLRTARAFEALQAASERVVALARAEESAAASLLGTEKGVAAGTRTLIDVLNARQQLFDTRRARARANSEFLLGMLDLHAAAGELTDAAIGSVNEMLATGEPVELAAR